MVCIYCDSSTSVANSRLQKQPNQVWRRRTCNNCGTTFTTHEKIELGGSLVVKHRDGRLLPFSRDVLFISMYESCKHRPYSVAAAGSLTETVIAALRKTISQGAVERDAIVHTAHGVLERFDKGAATIYAAYHPAANDN